MKNTLSTNTLGSLFGTVKPFAVDSFLDSFFKDDFWNVFDSLNSKASYPVDTYWNKDKSLVIEVPLAGFKKEDISLNVGEDYLNLSVKKREKKEDVTYHSEGIRKKELSLKWYLNDTFERDLIGSSFEDGLLKITLPVKVVKEKETASREIVIS